MTIYRLVGSIRKKSQNIPFHPWKCPRNYFKGPLYSVSLAGYHQWHFISTIQQLLHLGMMGSKIRQCCYSCKVKMVQK